MKKSVALLTAFCFLLLGRCAPAPDTAEEMRRQELWKISYEIPAAFDPIGESNAFRKGMRFPGQYLHSYEARFGQGADDLYLDVIQEEKGGENKGYESAADYYEKNFSKAEAGEDGAYTAFTRLDDVEMEYFTAYHYTYERPGPGPENSLQESGRDLIYERWGEQYLFETEENIYVFALSEQGENKLASKVLREVVESIRIK